VTSKEPAYVEASRARKGTDWYVSREELGADGQDADRIKRLAEAMGRCRTPMSSLAYPELPDAEWGRGFTHSLERYGPERYIPRLPGLLRTIHRAGERSTSERSR
jgi:hypothetical protein